MMRAFTPFFLNILLPSLQRSLFSTKKKRKKENWGGRGTWKKIGALRGRCAPEGRGEGGGGGSLFLLFFFSFFYYFLFFGAFTRTEIWDLHPLLGCNSFLFTTVASELRRGASSLVLGFLLHSLPLTKKKKKKRSINSLLTESASVFHADRDAYF